MKFSSKLCKCKKKHDKKDPQLAAWFSVTLQSVQKEEEVAVLIGNKHHGWIVG